MNLVACIVLKSEDGIDEYYIDIAIRSLVPYVSGIYIQDQGCTDDTIKVIQNIKTSVPIFIEEELTNLPRFSAGYNECLYRNKAIERCEQLFRPEWIVQNDADDFFTNYFFERFLEMDSKGELAGAKSIYYATERFIAPGFKSGYRGDMVEMGGQYFHDGHNKVWRADAKPRYPVTDGGAFHHALTDLYPAIVMSPNEVCNIHLHRSFGPKAFNYWRSEGDVFDETVPFNPRRQAPKLWCAPANMGSWVKSDYQWTWYVMEKWERWGDLDEQRRSYK